jgi:hypothetical protein
LQRYKNADDAPEDVFERGFRLNDLAYDEPQFALSVIKDVVSRYAEPDLFTEARPTPSKSSACWALGRLRRYLARMVTESSLMSRRRQEQIAASVGPLHVYGSMECQTSYGLVCSASSAGSRHKQRPFSTAHATNLPAACRSKCCHSVQKLVHPEADNLGPSITVGTLRDVMAR